MFKRIFLAINLPEKTKKQLLTITKDLKIQFPENAIKWTKSENLHVTVFFFGNKNEDEVKNIIQSASNLDIEKFKLKIEKITYGPNSENPRMIWAVLSFSPKIEQIANFFSGGKKNENDSIFYVTLARINRFACNEMEFLPEIDCDLDIDFFVPSMELMESKLNQKNSEYKEIEKIIFK